MAAGVTITRQEIDRARKDLGTFARLVGRPLEAWQLDALKLETWQTILVAPRQTGKSYSLAVLACWWAFRKARQRVLVISSVEGSALELLANVREIAAHPLLAGSVTDELKFKVSLRNGSRIESVTSSQRAVRGKSIDLLIMDEAAFIDDQVLGAAALPTTAARPAARVVVASTPWGSEGVFYAWAMAGLDPANLITRTFTWSLGQAPWIVPEVIEAARQTLPKLQFEAEYLGRWVSAGAFFDHDDLAACVCAFPMTRDGGGAPACVGLDWGRQRDRHALAVAGLLDDFGRNARPVIIIPWVETSKRDYDAQFAEIAGVAALWSAVIRSETNGPGGPATELLAKQVTRTPVVPVFSNQRDKQDAYARLSMLLEQRAIVLPDHPELLRQFGGITAKPTPGGGLRIEARVESIHDDICDAVALAVAGLPANLAQVPARAAPEGTGWLETPGGIQVPVPVVTIRAEESYSSLYGGYVSCAACHLPYPSRKAECQYCRTPNPDFDGEAQAVSAQSAPLVLAPGEAVPIPNSWAPDLMLCPAGHKYLGAYSETCPACDGGRSRPASGQGIGALPGGLASRLSGLLARR